MAICPIFIFRFDGDYLGPVVRVIKWRMLAREEIALDKVSGLFCARELVTLVHIWGEPCH
jgi:hypothetical protein